MRDVKVTIAIPIYNAKDYLSFAIQSCINQSYKEWELLLMEDGSTDGSDVIAKSYAAKDSRIRFISDGQNLGLIFRLNQSIRLAKGKYYARMDADDIMAVQRIEEEVTFLESHPDFDVVGSSIMTIDNNNRIIGSGCSENPVSGFIHPTVLGHTCWFLNNPYQDWALRAEDFELWTRTRERSRFYALGKPLLFYREFGVPTMNKYCLTQRTLLRIFFQYKRYHKSLLWCLKNVFVTLCKVIVYSFFALFGRLDFVVSKRRRKPLSKDLWLTEHDLNNSIQS